jgi:hypothetical protein
LKKPEESPPTPVQLETTPMPEAETIGRGKMRRKMQLDD